MNSIEDNLENMPVDINCGFEDSSEENLMTSSVIVVNVPLEVFQSETETKIEFESLFRVIEENATFEYLRSFRRVRVNYSSIEAAAIARMQYNGSQFKDNLIRCFFAHIFKEKSENKYLEPPALEKQFLISPPASPPVGWEQVRESGPVIDVELMARLAALTATRGIHSEDEPLETEVHPGTDTTPSIIVYAVPPEEHSSFHTPHYAPPPAKLPRTPCPERI